MPSFRVVGPGRAGMSLVAALAALPANDRDTYRALAAEARRLAGRREPGAGT